MTNPLLRLGELGQSPWYDFITCDLVTSGELSRLIREDGLLGMTTNPTIFGRPEVRIEAELRTAEQRRAELAAIGIDLADVTARLEAEGVSKFAASYESLLKGIESKMEEIAVR